MKEIGAVTHLNIFNTDEKFIKYTIYRVNTKKINEFTFYTIMNLMKYIR